MSFTRQDNQTDAPAARKPVAEYWYAVRPEENAVLSLREVHVDPFSVGDIWLLRGSALDLVIDTGSGMVALAPLIGSLCDKPVAAVALNSYYDHAGGWGGFAQRICHRLDAAALQAPALENASISLYLDDDRLRALPRAGYSTASYRMQGAAPTRTVEDGESIELGNRSLQVLHAPGRGRGGMALWEAASGSLFTSDMLYDGEHGQAWPPEEPALYAQTLSRFRALPVHTVYPGHYGSFGRGRMLELIDAQLADLARRARP